VQRYSLYHVVFVTLDAGERPSDKRREKTKNISQKVKTTENTVRN